MYWVKTGYSDYQLVVLPLHGRGNKGGEGAGVKVIGYKKPADPKSPWKTQLIDESMHLTHNITSKDLGAGAGETIFIGGKEGIKSFSYQDGEWFSEPTEESTLEDHSFGELSLADNPSIGMLLAGVEPMHGNQVTVYLGPIGKTESTQLRRIVIDETLKEGHGIATGDFLGNGSVQTVAGWRTPNEDGDIGIKLYEPINEGYTEFKTHWIDQNGMATESLTAADLNGDGKLDIIAAGRSTNNLKVYWNRR
jgi:hypothetical protein